MLDDALITALGEINKVLKEKYPKRIERTFLITFIISIVIIPILLFEHWAGRIAGLILVGLFFSSIIFNNKKSKAN